ncbi:hypothetical protein ABBQ38_010033 [Trebouxia sp. C0009 RCD-2024]
MDDLEKLQSFAVDTVDSYAVDCACYEEDSVRSHYIDIDDFDYEEMRSHPIEVELRSHPIDVELRSHFIDFLSVATQPPIDPIDANHTELQSDAINLDGEIEGDSLQYDASQVQDDGYAESVGDNFSGCYDLSDFAILDTCKR